MPRATAASREVIDRDLFGAPPVETEAYLTKLRQAVVDKNTHWFDRYRVTDGYATYGERAFLTFIKGNVRDVNAANAAKRDRIGHPADQLRRARARAVDPRRHDRESRPPHLGRRARARSARRRH